MSWRGQGHFKKLYLVLVLSAFWLVSSLVITLFPFRAHALVPELLDSTDSLVRSTGQKTKLLQSLLNSQNNSSDNSGSRSSSSSNADDQTAANTTDTSSAATTGDSKKASHASSTIHLAASPLEMVASPAAELASSDAAGVVKGASVVATDGRPRLVLLEPSDEGWHVLGLAWYWWLAAVILAGSGSIAMREFRRLTKVEDSATLVG